MSKMAELEMDILDMLDEGYRPASIASILNVPVTYVYDVVEIQQEKGNTEVFSPFETVNS